jgi:glycosyltransferase involved in cell wall biosynthesis
VTGAYEHADLPRLVQEYKVDMALIPSIWPETFSYTTQECILMDIPVAVFDLGAPAERVRQYPKGLVIEKIDADSALDKILDYLQNNNS